MKIINQRQNQAIKKMDRDQAGLPSVLSGLHDELRVLKVERKIHIEKLIAADKRSQTQTEESVRLQEIVAKLKELLKARNLEGVDKLQEHIKRLRDELEARDNKVEELTRKVASSEHLRNMELREIRSKYSKLAKECERLREESGKLAAQVQEKDRKIAAMSIYNNIHRPRQRTMSMSTDMVCELPTDDEPNPGSLRTLSETTPYPDLPFRLAYSLPGSIRAPSNLSLQSGISLSNDLLTLERLNELGWSLSPPPANFDEDDSLEAKTGAAAAEEQVDDSAAQEIPACFPHTDIPLDGIPEEHCDRADEDDDLGCHGNDTLGGLSVPSDPAKTPLKLSGGDEAVYGHDFHSPSASPVASGSAKGSGDSPADDSQHALAMDSAGTGQAQEQEHTETPALQHPPSTPAPASTRRFKPNLFSKMRKEPAKSAVSQEANPSIDTHDTNASTHSVVDHEPKNDVHEADADNSSHSMQSANASDESTSRGPTEDETNTPKILERLPPAHEPFRDEDGSANDHSVQLTESEAEGAMHADTDKMPPRFDEKLPDESDIEANSQRPKQPAKLGRLSNASIWLHSSTPDALPAKSNTKPPTPLESKSKPHKLDFLREAVHDGAAKAAERDAQPYIPSAMDGTPRRSRKAEKTPPSQEQSTVRDGKPRDGDPRRHKGTEKPGWLGGVPTLSKLSLHGGKPQKHA
ncbi:ciliary protein causing Leber congenital amaurosis disease-domain-containing protein [Polychytrium aggregatum]|uniref:ciliary protein causing Leber congenital amaurosis disease-domain-containing protein n=1 Tax=Polychytrium aggregatum TaxID=110093 RepID=UPI0022FEFD2F|nr:ciliary protein causing Leber congenital amaurosis disease-domain-containing protein [Polychytrium aggregatum]KAI9203076.1 ciliary protein causing Leber congenital amaurosis disease-domain-containing protein [Polychytrium aggregatum]